MIPIGDGPRSGAVPYITRALIALNVVVFLVVLTFSTAIPTSRGEAQVQFDEQTASICYGLETAPTQTDRFYCKWSFQPREWFDTLKGQSATPKQSTALVLATILTSLFIHAGWLHIAGNMLFLWVFGDNVEDRFGHVPFLVFYLLSGVAANLLQGAMDPATVIPNVGASGAIAGVLGAYIVYFPRAKIRALIPFLFFIPLHVPAFLMIGLWFLTNLFSGLGTLGTAEGASSGVAFFAHIGGFLFGAAVVLALGRPGRDRGLSRDSWPP